MSEKVSLDMCGQQRFNSACAFVQWDQNLLCTVWIAKDAKFLHADKTQIRLHDSAG